MKSIRQIVALGSILIVTAAQAAVTVTSLNDSGPGSLRQAIADAAPGDTINFAVTGTITLTSGELVIDKNLTVSGPGPGNLTVEGNAASRVFHIANAVTVGIASLTVSNGAAAGIGIYNDHAMLTISNCSAYGQPISIGNIGEYYGSATLVVSNCTVGSIYNDGYSGSATMTVIASTVSNASSVGIVNTGYNSGSATLTISASTVSGSYYDGIMNEGSASGDATLTISNCTVSGNSGYGINNSGAYSGRATVTISATTVSGNSSYGINNYSANSGRATVTISATTVSGNWQGIRNYGYSGSATLEIGDTILNAGASGANITNDFGTITSHGYNLSSDNGGGFLTATGDQINTDPMLGPLQNNGGPTFTHALLPGSPAIDAGNSGGLTTDQRGLPRPVDNPAIANAAGGDGSDIGAFEVQPTGPVLAAQIQQPINADGSSTFKAKTGVVPVKFTLTSGGAPTCALPPATIAVTRLGGTTPGPIDEAAYSLAADSGSNFRISDCQYVYNLATKSFGAGTYRVEIKINGIVVGSTTFELK